MLLEAFGCRYTWNSAATTRQVFRALSFPLVFSAHKFLVSSDFFLSCTLVLTASTSSVRKTGKREKSWRERDGVTMLE